MPRKKSRSDLVVLSRHAPATHERVALPLSERHLNFGDRWGYAPAPEAHDYIKLQKRYPLFIGGKFVAPKSGKYFDSINPATEEKLAEIAEANVADVGAAVSAARRAYKNVWGKMPGRERGKFLFRIARLIQEKSRELAVLETMDGGKTIKESRDIDLPLVAAHFFYYAGWADKLDYAFPGRTARPLGVAGQIIPWNFPLLMAAWKLAPALAVGNTCVLKPAETTSITAMHLAEILQQAELPDGVVNIVTGAKDGLSKVLAEHDDVEGLWYFGSPEGMKAVEFASASNMKRTWANWRTRDWLVAREGEGREFLRAASQVKNVWVPYGE
jgi:aldehyde dehydrogenase (NAD+)